MADFLTNLWESVFTPGTTPTLIIATNVTFALLQLLLGTLLVATYSIHFVILSFLCGGLWYSINWFVAELSAAQVKEEEAKHLRKKITRSGDWKTKGEVDDSADDEGEDTEVEGGMKESTGSLMNEPRVEDRKAREDIKTSADASSSSRLGAGGSGARLRKVDDSDRSGEISTDSEWEQIER